MENIPYIDKKVSKELVFEESIDKIVSDLYPDIREILSVDAYVFIHEIVSQNERVLISGEIKCEVCFLGEDNENILKMDVSLSFARVDEINAKDGMLWCTAELLNIQANIVNPRKISITAEVLAKTNVYKKDKLITNNELPYEVLSSKHKVKLIDSINFGEFSISENIIFDSNHLEDGELYSSTPIITVNDVKVLKNKIMIRGSVDIHGYYISQNEISETTSTLSFSQIIDVSLENENLEHDVEISVKSFELEHTFEKEYNINLDLRCKFCQFETREISVTEDMYSTKTELHYKKQSVKIMCIGDIEMADFNSNYSLQTEDICEKIVATKARMVKTQASNGKYDVFLYLNVIYLSNGKLKCYNNRAKVLSDIDIHAIKNVKVTVISQGELKITAEVLRIINSELNFDVFIDIAEGEEKTSEDSVLILKYMSKKTLIFEIAKQYNTTELAIKEANGIELNEQYISDKMLIIPK